MNSLKSFSDRLAAAGFLVEPGSNPKQAMVNGPDGVRVEMTEDENSPQAVKSHHIHWYTEKPEEIRAWYASTFGAVPGTRGKFLAADLPGVNLTFSQSDIHNAPMKGRALDHIGFEVKNLKSFCHELEANGIHLDVECREMRDLGISIAFLTDPWGTSIELTEGLDR